MLGKLVSVSKESPEALPSSCSLAVASDWLAALLAANQKLHLKIVVSYPCFYPRIALVALTPGGKMSYYKPFVRGITSYQWIPLTKGHWCGTLIRDVACKRPGGAAPAGNLATPTGNFAHHTGKLKPPTKLLTPQNCILTAIYAPNN